MKWICLNCGYVVDREGYTEICSQCGQPTMKGEQHEQENQDEDKETYR